MTTALSSISGFLSLLDPEEISTNKEFALENLNHLVDQFWHEISDNISLLYVLFYNNSFFFFDIVPRVLTFTCLFF